MVSFLRTSLETNEIVLRDSTAVEWKTKSLVSDSPVFDLSLTDHWLRKALPSCALVFSLCLVLHGWDFVSRSLSSSGLCNLLYWAANTEMSTTGDLDHTGLMHKSMKINRFTLFLSNPHRYFNEVVQMSSIITFILKNGRNVYLLNDIEKWHLHLNFAETVKIACASKGRTFF